METLLHVFLVIFVRGGAPERKQIIGIIATILEREENPCIISHCKLLVKRIEAHSKGQSTFSPNFFPSTAITPSQERRENYLLMSILARQGICNVPKKSFMDNSDNLTWTQIGGISSPVDVSVAHILNFNLHRLVCSGFFISKISRYFF